MPTSPSTLGQDDDQQLLWGYPGILWSTGVPQPAFLEDLTTVFVPYVADLHDANLNQRDSDTLVANDRATVRAAKPDYDEDINTAYAAYLS